MSIPEMRKTARDRSKWRNGFWSTPGSSLWWQGHECMFGFRLVSRKHTIRKFIHGKENKYPINTFINSSARVLSLIWFLCSHHKSKPIQEKRKVFTLYFRNFAIMAKITNKQGFIWVSIRNKTIKWLQYIS
jgi:hypothetical protein